MTINDAHMPELAPMTETDIKEVMSIETRAYPQPWTEGIFRDCLRVGYSCWCYKQRRRIIGYLVASIAVEELHILNLCIAPEFQGRQFGRNLLRQAERLGQQGDAKKSFLEVRPTNLAAIRLYLNSGYQRIGLRKNYYPSANGCREDAVVMCKSLTPQGTQSSKPISTD